MVRGRCRVQCPPSTPASDHHHHQTQRHICQLRHKEACRVSAVQVSTHSGHTLSELTNILYLLALVILTLFSLVDTITEGSWHLLFIYYWLTHSLFLLLLAQLHRLVTTAHEQIAMEVGAGWKQDICHFQQGVTHSLHLGLWTFRGSWI